MAFAVSRMARLVAIRRHRRRPDEVGLKLRQHATERLVFLQPHVENANLVVGNHGGDRRQRDRLAEPDRVLETNAAWLERCGLYQEDSHAAAFASAVPGKIACFFRKGTARFWPASGRPASVSDPISRAV
jgi:hypothetical protein